MMKESTAHKKEKENEIFAMDVSRMTRQHMIYVTFRMAKERLEANQFKDQGVKLLLETAIKIFALKQLIIDHQSLYESGYFGKGSAYLLDQAYRGLLDTMRPQMIGIVECFSESFEFLPTTIGNKYGDIYEMQFETAKNSRLNDGIVPSFFQTHMKPVMTMRQPQVPKL